MESKAVVTLEDLVNWTTTVFTPKERQTIALLNPTPKSIRLIADLVAISALYSINIAPRPGGERHFKGQSDLKTCLLDIVGTALKSFDIAKVNSNKIAQFLTSVPDDIKAITQNITIADASNVGTLVLPEIRQLLKGVSDVTKWATETYQQFAILPDHIDELSESVIHTKSQSEVATIKEGALKQARDYVQKLLEDRRTVIEKIMKQQQDKRDSVQEEANAAADDNESSSLIGLPQHIHILIAQLNQRLLMDFLQEIYELHKCPLEKLSDKAWVIVYTLDQLMETPEISTITLRIYFQEARDLAERFADLHILLFNTSLHRQVLELKTEVAAWTYKLATQEEIDETKKKKETKDINVNEGKDLNEVREVLRRSFATLMDLREAWRSVMLFFTELQIALEIKLSASADKFADLAIKSGKLTPLMKKRLMVQAIEVCATSCSAALAACSYVKVNKLYFDPNLSKVQKLLGYTDPVQVESLRKEIAEGCNLAETEIVKVTSSVSHQTLLDYREVAKEICDTPCED